MKFRFDEMVNAASRARTEAARIMKKRKLPPLFLCSLSITPARLSPSKNVLFHSALWNVHWIRLPQRYAALRDTFMFALSLMKIKNLPTCFPERTIQEGSTETGCAWRKNRFLDQAPHQSLAIVAKPPANESRKSPLVKRWWPGLGCLYNFSCRHQCLLDSGR